MVQVIPTLRIYDMDYDVLATVVYWINLVVNLVHYGAISITIYNEMIVPLMITDTVTGEHGRL